jgi:glycosyltransferase involved in cell wall biosynthesis
VRDVRQTIRAVGPDVAIGIGTTCSILVALAARGLPSRTVGCEYSAPNRSAISPAQKIMRRLTYRLLDAVTAETPEATMWFTRNIKARRCVMIPKSVPWLFTDEAATEGEPGPRRKLVLAAGRLVPVKGYDLLIQSFAKLAASRPDWSLVIAGDGPQRPVLAEAIRVSGVSDRISLTGWATGIAHWYARASIFVVSSVFEGGPNVLIEAMAHGVPAVSFDCDMGPRTIIRDGIDGILVPPQDEAALAAALARLMDDEDLRTRMAARATDARERFSEAKMLAAWDALFAEIGVRARV